MNGGAVEGDQLRQRFGSILIIQKKQRFVVSCSVQDMHDHHLIMFGAIENQVVAEGAPTDVITLIARNERKGAGRIAKPQGGGTQFFHKA